MSDDFLSCPVFFGAENGRATKFSRIYIVRDKFGVLWIGPANMMKDFSPKYFIKNIRTIKLQTSVKIFNAILNCSQQI